MIAAESYFGDKLRSPAAGSLTSAHDATHRPPMLALGCAAALAGCGGGTELLKGPVSSGIKASSPQAGEKLGFPAVATKNTTRVAGSDPIADAAGVALAVYPSNGAGTHPAAVTIAPTDDWQAALASAVLMAPPIRAPILLSHQLRAPVRQRRRARSRSPPTGSGVIAGAQVIRVGDVPAPGGEHSVAISGRDPYALAAAIDRSRALRAARRARTS